MKITLSGCLQSPSWELTQDLIRQVLKDEKGKLINIQRLDNGVDYRGVGEYALKYRTGANEIIPVEFTVER